VQLKSGTNQLHGSVIRIQPEQREKANPFFLPAGQRKPKSSTTSSAALWGRSDPQNKLFFFGSFDGQFIRQNASQIDTGPTAPSVSGDMSGSTTPIYDPTYRDRHRNGKNTFRRPPDPASRQDPTALLIQKLFPSPISPDREQLLRDRRLQCEPVQVRREGQLESHREPSLTARLGALDYTTFQSRTSWRQRRRRQFVGYTRRPYGGDVFNGNRIGNLRG